MRIEGPVHGKHMTFFRGAVQHLSFLSPPYSQLENDAQPSHKPDTSNITYLFET